MKDIAAPMKVSIPGKNPKVEDTFEGMISLVNFEQTVPRIPTAIEVISLPVIIT